MRIGDRITLRNVKLDCYLMADGTLVESLFATETSDIDCFEEAIFCIHLQRQYSASIELSEFMDTYTFDNNDKTNSTKSKYLQALLVL